MRRDPRFLLLWVIALCGVGLYLAGCGGGNPGHLGPGGGGGNPPPPVGTASIHGIIVDASNVATRVTGALVKVPGQEVAVQVTPGEFRFDHLPTGTVTVSITFPNSTAYRPMQLSVRTIGGETTELFVAAIPGGSAVPNLVSLSPGSVQVDVGAQVQFTATVTSLGLTSSLKPSLALSGDIGTITPSGLFVATKEGAGELTATVGSSSDTSTIAVGPPTAPRLGTLSVSPSTLPAEGGDVRISVPATDGDGIQSVIAQVLYPTDTTPHSVSLVLESGTAQDGTWATLISVGANSNPTDAKGHQLPQTYSVRVVANDASGQTAISQWQDFTVAGLSPPPGPPGGGS